MSDFFKFVDSDLTKDQSKRKVDPMLFSNSPEPEIIFLAETLMSSRQLTKLNTLLNKEFGPVNYQVVYAYKFKVSKSERKKNMVEFASKNSVDLNRYLKPNVPVVPIGRSLYSITLDTNIQTKTFYDIIFNPDSGFYSSDYRTRVFPIDNFLIWDEDDVFEKLFAVRQIGRALEAAEQPAVRCMRPKCIEVENPNEFLIEHYGPGEVAWDTETGGLNYMVDRIGCLSLSFDGVTGYYLDWDKIDIDILNKFFEGKFQIGANLKFDVKFTRFRGVSNAKTGFDTMQAGHLLNEMRSNSLKTHAWLYTTFGGYDRALEVYKKKYPKYFTYLNLPHSMLVKYACMDAIVTFQVYKKMKAHMDWIDENFNHLDNGWSMKRYFEEKMIPTSNAFADIEMEGMLINWDKVTEVSNKLQGEINTVKQRLQLRFAAVLRETKREGKGYYQHLGDKLSSIIEKCGPVNISSNDQVGQLLEIMGWSNQGRNKKKNFFVNDTTLTEWVKEGHKEAEDLVTLHELSTLYNTFVGDEASNSGIWQYKQADGRVHPTFMVMMADSGRHKCFNPNLQNIPKHSSWAKDIRAFFITPGDDFVLGEFDAAGFQLRICGALSGDAAMKNAFVNLGGDLHSMSAQALFMQKTSLAEFLANKGQKPFKDYRFKAKAVNFSLIFNTTAFSFAKENLVGEWTLDDAEVYLKEHGLEDKPWDLLNRGIMEDVDLNFCKFWACAIQIKKLFFKQYPTVKKWIEKNIKFAHENGYLPSAHGVYRRLPQLLYVGKDGFRSKVKNLENISCNTSVQNFESALMQEVVIQLNSYIKENNLESRIVGAVHDSVVLYLKRSEVQLLARKAKEIFEEDRPENNGIPMELDIEIADPLKGEFWGFGKEINIEEYTA